MKVKELRRMLKGLDGERLVILSSDPEGNSYSPVGHVSGYAEDSVYNEEKQEIGMASLSAGAISIGMTEADLIKGEPCILISPKY